MTFELKLKNFIFISITSLILPSCAVFDKYGDNKHTWYHASLTKAEKDSIKSERLITKK